METINNTHSHPVYMLKLIKMVRRATTKYSKCQKEKNENQGTEQIHKMIVFVALCTSKANRF